MSRLRRSAALIAIAASMSVVSTNRVQAETQAGWCSTVCGLAAGACCLASEVLCEVCVLGHAPCTAYCITKFPSGA